ncbi:MAG: FAD binding domain-containing protein [Acidobacteria bacterium]|nr:FAD binding domain-containing protein [Acidobacteriota bacterium]
MIRFILNNENISTSEPSGATVLDFVRYRKNLKGTKIGCREGDCGACTILVGELVGEKVKYRSMTSCLMPLSNAAGKHIVTVEGINQEDGSLTPVQKALVDESGTQCGFCTVGFVMSLTGFCLEGGTPEMAVSAVDGNICRCTGYKSIERAAEGISRQLAVGSWRCTPEYFSRIPERLQKLATEHCQPPTANRQLSFVGGGTDTYVQKPEWMADNESTPLLYDENLRGIRDFGENIEIGGSATVTDLLESPVMQSVFPDLYKHLKLVSSTAIRNMATLAGNFVNASPIGDMTVWFLALDAELTLAPGSPPYEGGVAAASADGVVLSGRTFKLRDLYLGYKQLAKQPDEIITAIRFTKPTGNFRFNFEKVCKRTYLDIATVNTAISLRVSSPHVSKGSSSPQRALTNVRATDTIIDAHVSAGGVGPIPLYLKETSAYLTGREINEETITAANDIMQSEISPISDVRGTADYKRLLLRQLFRAHFVEMFGI